MPEEKHLWFCGLILRNSLKEMTFIGKHIVTFPCGKRQKSVSSLSVTIPVISKQEVSISGFIMETIAIFVPCVPW